MNRKGYWTALVGHLLITMIIGMFTINLLIMTVAIGTGVISLAREVGSSIQRMVQDEQG